MKPASSGIGAWTERLMAMDDATWARHANPWSGWTRMSVLPLFVLAVWSRVWLGWWSLVPIAAVVLWTWLNPRLFGEPASLDNWMSQGVLGERIWLARKTDPIPEHHARATLVLNTASVLGLVAMLWGLWVLEPFLTLGGMVTTMGAKLWFLDRMVWLKADTDQTHAADKDIETS